MGVPCGLHLGVFSRVQYYDFGKIFAGKKLDKKLAILTRNMYSHLCGKNYHNNDFQENCRFCEIILVENAKTTCIIY
jgi:hypothetical protein